MATNRLTQEEIVRETVGFYNANNRAAVEKNNLIGGYSTSKCEYVTPDNKMCAVGRCLTKKGLARVMKTCPDDSAGDLGIKVGLDNVLKKKYTGHDELFWLRLQRLHDNKNYWDEKGLNERGVRQVKEVFGVYL
jgi:hypothetical protein